MKNYKTLIFAALFTAMLGYFAYLKGWILADFPSVSPQQAISMMSEDKNLSIIDVRSPREYKSGHLAKAVSIPLSGIEESAELQRYKNGKVLVYCRSGIRSVAASRYMKSQGYSPINISGGLKALKDAGVQTVR
jgi:rhodanese-related sulfurtransferase